MALERLSSSSSLPTPKSSILATRNNRLPPHHKRSKDQDHRRILTQAQEIYQHLLRAMPHALQYLETRGITEHGRELSKLGYADGKALRHIWQRDEKQWQAATQAGLFSSHGKEWLTGRIILPDLDAVGHVLWMIGRLVPANHAIRPSEKYLGLPMTKGLMGYHQALALWHSQQHDSLQAILLLEGALDYVLAQQWALPVLPVALLGTHPSRRQWAELLHLQQVTGLPIIDWHDADEAGRQAALQVYERAPGPLLLFPEMVGVNDLADLSQRPDGLLRLRHAWHAISDSREE